MGKEETRTERGGDDGEREDSHGKRRPRGKRREMIGKELGSHGKRWERQGGEEVHEEKGGP